MVLFAAPLARSPCHRTIPLAGPDVEMLPPPAANTNTDTVLTRQYEYPHTRLVGTAYPSRSAACDSSVLSRRQMSAVANDSALLIQLCENDFARLIVCRGVRGVPPAPAAHPARGRPRLAPRPRGRARPPRPCGPAAEGGPALRLNAARQRASDTKRQCNEPLAYI